jgi:DNA processing protein
MDDHLYWLAWGQMPRIKHAWIRKLVNTFGSAEAAWSASKKSLISELGVKDPSAFLNARSRASSLDTAKEIVKWNQANGVEILTFLDPQYPGKLHHCHDAPVYLYAKGTVLNWSNQPSIAIVGSRDATGYGRWATERIIEEVKPYNPIVVSGLAYGIDITAHREAMRQGLKTVAVLGSGLGRVYPSAHSREFKQITAGGHIAISENDPWAKPDRENFPKRNRIIAGLVDALSVVESRVKGGAWITARLANDYNREVFAVPGSWHNDVSAGCHELIARHRAAILPYPEMLPSVLGWDKNTSTPPSTAQLELFPEEDQQIAKWLNNCQSPISLDDLSVQYGLSVQDLQVKALHWEMKGLVEILPGKYIKLSAA